MTRGRVIAGPIPPGEDPDEYDRRRRRIMRSLVYGLYVMASEWEGRASAMTINFLTQVCVDPKLVAVGVESESYTWELARRAQAFSVQFINRSEPELARRFGKRPEHDPAARTLAGVPYHRGRSVAAPVLVPSPAWLECRIVETKGLGSHDLVVAEVVDVGLREGVDLVPLRMEDTRMSYGG
jgi:flavin reductase (DIM6/NTAB) family NADH-FMN oxidoreductase RutF